MEKIKKTVCEIIDMNGGEVLYSPSVHFYKDQEPIVSCFITDTVAGEREHVQGSKILEDIYTATQLMIEHREDYKAKRRAELEKELACLMEHLS